MHIHRYSDITELNGLQLKATAHYFCTVTDEQDLLELAQEAERHEISILPLGSGTNTIWGAPRIKKLVTQVSIPGFEIVEERGDEVFVRIGAGEIWDEVVQRTVDLGFSGIEMLSSIPGTTGATPVQNVGAYGGEISDTLESIEIYDLEYKQYRTLVNSECHFGYRNSIFKEVLKNKCVIHHITLKLSKNDPIIPKYRDVENYFSSTSNDKPSLAEIREVITMIRSKKLPDPKVIPNCGSFFKNPVVSKEFAQTLLADHPGISQHIDGENVKVSAGSLIEGAGLKGVSFGNISTYAHNALVLTSNKQATFEDVQSAIETIGNMVYKKYLIKLESEPEIVT